MTLQAIAFLVVVWGIIIAATGYCFKKLLTSQRRFDPSDDS